MKNEEAELSILGAILLDNLAMDKIPDITPEHFTTEARSEIFMAMLDLHLSGSVIDRITICSGRPTITRGMVDYLVDYVPTSENIGYYANLVRDCRKRRDLVEAISSSLQAAKDIKNIKEAIDKVEEKILSVRNFGTRDQGASIQQILRKAHKDLEHRFENRGKILGLPSGFCDIDNMTAGFQKGDLIILAARPSMGKTAFALNLLESFCQSGTSAMFFSLEMGGSSLVQRNMASIGRINAQRMRTGNFSDSDWPRLQAATEKINQWKLHIEEGHGQTILDIRAAARRQSRSKDGLDVVIVDYLQLINSHERTTNREQEVAKMSRSLKQLAQELNCPVIVLSQLNRGVEGREDKRPRNSDLRESGSLEQDADLIIFLHRDSYFCKECRKDNKDCGAGHYNTSEAIISKQRNGPTGTVDLMWFGELCRFESATKYY